MYDLLLSGGWIVDGTGAPGRLADIAIRDGRIVSVGRVEEPSKRTIDVSGLVVSPGFIDIHTHYDAQVFWDPVAAPSCLHGVTTIIGGNCGFTIAPMRPEHIDYIAGMLAVVEGMPLASLQSGPRWDWTSFGDYLDRLDGRVGLNMGFLVGHSTLRRIVMGEAAVGSSADAKQLAEMKRLLHASLAEGAMGFSSSVVDAHIDGNSKPVPSRFATRDELYELARVTREHPGTVLEYAPGIPGVFGNDEVDAMIRMSQLANRPLNWNNLRIQSADPTFADSLMEYGTRAASCGAEVTVLTFPDSTFQLVTLSSNRLWSSLPGWADVMHAPLDERVALFKRSDVRDRLRRDAAPARNSASAFIRCMAHWENLVFADLALPRHASLKGRVVGAVARERGEDPLDTLLNVAVAEGLKTYFEMRFEEDEDESVWRQRARAWRDPRVVLGASDAGAHVDQICAARYTTSLLGRSVRGRQLLELEEAVRLLTDVPARYYGLRGRGRIAEGWQADLVVFDRKRIDYGPVEFRQDMPAGASRLYCSAVGIEYVFVNGEPVVKSGQVTGNLPGSVLRSKNLDTRSVRSA